MAENVRRAGSSVSTLTRAKKAAAILVSVGPEIAATVLRSFSESELEAMALEVATLGQLDSDEIDAIFSEFHGEILGHEHLLKGGEHHARQMLRQIKGEEGDEIIDRLLGSVRSTPFYFLRMHEPAEILQHLRDEHPQTIALILAYLPTKLAADLLAGLDAGLQTEVARRIATIESPANDVIASVENALSARFGVVQRRTDEDLHGGIEELAQLLNYSDRATEKAILGELEATDPILAEEVRALMFVFEDIVSLDDRSVQEVSRQVELKILALALKGVGDDVKETIERNLSERARETLEEEIELLGPVRVRDVQEAQSEIVRKIRQLEEAGTIVLSRGGEGDMIE